MGLLQNTSPTQDQEWNLADELNMDFSTDSLFDDIPSKAKALRGNEVVQSTDREFNTSAEGSFVPGSAIAPIETPRSRASADSILREREAQLSGNPLDNFQAPPVAKTEESEEEPSAYSTGQSISEGYRMISDIKRMQAGRTGRNAREVAREKALDNQAIGAVYSAMQQHLESKGYDPRLVDMLGTKQGGGFRTAEDIDRLFEIKSKGTTFQDENGEVVVAPDSDWDIVFEADRASRAQSLKSRKSAAGGGVEEISKWQGVMEKTLDAEGNVMPDRMGEYEKAASEIDRLTGAPTGVSKFASRYNSKQDRISKMTAAMDSGIPYKGLAAEQIPSEILKLNQETVELAVENAPYFGANDREAAAKWITDPATKGLPFRSDYEGKKIPHFVTSEPGVYNIWSPKEKTWMVVDKRKPNPETATAAEPTDNSQFSEAGKTGQKIRRAAGKLSGVAESGLAKAGVAVADLLPLSVNTGAAVIEGAAGVFDSPLKLDRMDYMEERAKKNKVGKYRVK